MVLRQEKKYFQSLTNPLWNSREIQCPAERGRAAPWRGGSFTAGRRRGWGWVSQQRHQRSIRETEIGPEPHTLNTATALPRFLVDLTQCTECSPEWSLKPNSVRLPTKSEHFYLKMDHQLQLEIIHSQKWCRICSSRILPFFPMSVYLFVSRHDISPFHSVKRGCDFKLYPPFHNIKYSF